MSQQRKTMCTYMKYIAGYKMEHFKGKSFYEVKEMFDNVYKQVTSFVPMDSVMEKKEQKEQVFQPDTERFCEKLQSICMILDMERVVTYDECVNKLQVDQYSEMADELLRKIVILANRPRQ
ncbi:hypothetical protein Tco_1301015 [Tanacetum coccineum]